MNKKLLDKIKLLRVKTGACMVHCKKALIETSYDLDEAVLYLRKKGFAIALKRNSKTALAGMISVLLDNDGKNAVILEVNCETDFVARSSCFIAYVSNLLKLFLYDDSFNENFYMLHNELCSYKKINDDRLDLISKVKENIIIKRIKRINITTGKLHYYVHGGSDIGKIGAVLSVDNNLENYFDLVKDISMQIVAMNPKYLNIEDIPLNIISKEKQLYFETIKDKYVDKNDFVIKKVIFGQLKKFYKDTVLLEQIFIKNSKLLVKDVIGEKFKLLNFTRFEVGENV